jgi:REP element-mobilizing transposase RayT
MGEPTKPIAYHVVFSTYGFWLPNDPRGSWSSEVRAVNLRPFGPATKVDTHRSVAHVPHNRALRLAAKKALTYPEVSFNGHQALSVIRGFAEQTAKSKYVIYACSILPQHVHMVIARHRYPVGQVVRLLRQAGTRRLLADGLHPFADQRAPNGRLPSVWGQDFWKVFLFSADDVRRRVAYVEQNPVRHGKRPQKWSFVRPFEEAPRQYPPR